MNALPRLTYQQHRRVCRLVHECCNYDEGNCLALDSGTSCPCVQSISYSLNCKWFRAAVLPVDGELCAALSPAPAARTRRCRECGRDFPAPRHNTLYCPACASDRAKRSKRAWARKKRAGM